MGQYGGSAYAQVCAGVLPHLANVVTRPNSRSTEEEILVTENAISAVAKVLKYNSSMVDLNTVSMHFCFTVIKQKKKNWLVPSVSLVYFVNRK
ncbi:unnamed protein product [Gongylonema pulchrum]|uniref:Ubiquitinyl hydrolase 1 n=1 Tax=Gongylonema pulchrum TaxID=637853 RepID=A0A183F1I2_9BILA|nr:unnamed protein product [Gongylonema pulchrum]